MGFLGITDQPWVLRINNQRLKTSWSLSSSSATFNRSFSVLAGSEVSIGFSCSGIGGRNLLFFLGWDGMVLALLFLSLPEMYQFVKSRDKWLRVNVSARGGGGNIQCTQVVDGEFLLLGWEAVCCLVFSEYYSFLVHSFLVRPPASPVDLKRKKVMSVWNKSLWFHCFWFK